MTAAAVGSLQLEVEGSGEPIVFVHGLGGTSNSFQPILDAFAGFRCMRPDLPGSGRSPRPYETLSIETMAQAILDVIEAVAGAPAHLIAHSMGTLVAQHVAARNPDSVKSLTLFGPILAPGEAARQRLRERAAFARREGLTAIADAVASAGLSSSTRASSPLAVAFVRESHMRQDVEGFAQSCEALAGAEAADWRLIRCPALAVTGDEDPIAPPSVAQQVADRARGGRARILERCGHWTPLERPKDCGRLAAEFVRAIP